MALRNDEQRILAEIERALVEEDPGLALGFAEWRVVMLGSLVAVVIGVVLMLWGGLVIMVIGVHLASPVLIIIGGIVAAAFPAMAGWRLSACRRRTTFRRGGEGPR